MFEFEDDAAFIAKLDAYEDASTDPGTKREYQRKRKLVTLRNGKRLYAWTYVYNHRTKLGRRIESGEVSVDLAFQDTYSPDQNDYGDEE